MMVRIWMIWRKKKHLSFAEHLSDRRCIWSSAEHSFKNTGIDYLFYRSVLDNTD